jgi:hypothetical protein
MLTIYGLCWPVVVCVRVPVLLYAHHVGASARDGVSNLGRQAGRGGPQAGTWAPADAPCGAGAGESEASDAGDDACRAGGGAAAVERGARSDPGRACGDEQAHVRRGGVSHPSAFHSGRSLAHDRGGRQQRGDDARDERIPGVVRAAHQLGARTPGHRVPRSLPRVGAGHADAGEERAGVHTLELAQAWDWLPGVLLDPCSSAFALPDWMPGPSVRVRDIPLLLPVALPRTWLLSTGWRKAGPISPWARPGAA